MPVGIAPDDLLEPCPHCGKMDWLEDPEIAGLAYCANCGRQRDYDH